MMSPFPNRSSFRRLSFTLGVWLLISTPLILSAEPEGANGKDSKKTENGKDSKKIENGKIWGSSRVQILTLRDCLQIAMEKQPKLLAVRESLHSAEAGQRGLEDVRFLGKHLIPDLQYRREQAAQGILASKAELHQAEQEVIQAVVWNYFSIVYAREQQKTIKELIDLIQTYYDQADKIVTGKDGGNRDINKNTVAMLSIALLKAKRNALPISSGEERAKAALQEAMALPCDQEFDIPEQALPTIDATLDREYLVQQAISRRGEMMLASIGSEVSRLEVFAQWSIKYRLRTQTYSSTSDIHHQLIPQGSKDGEYRPDAIAPEMPHHLVGTRENRTAKVQALSIRAAAMVAKTKDLITLEAKNAFILWESATKKAALAQEESKKSKELLTRLLKVVNEEKGVTYETVLRLQAEYTEAVAAYNEARYQQIVNLAALERITGGGIIVNYPGR